MAPLPKPLHMRQRRNKVVTAATLVVDEPHMEWPKLPSGRKWHPRVRRWWRMVGESPMADEYLPSDIEGLLILADLYDMYETEKDRDRKVKISLAIQRHRSSYGETPLDRRRLQWSVKRDDHRGGGAPLEEPTPIARARDPRKALLA